ncbi:MAG TPA: aminotransferase class IV [Candidatus Binatia bacterium]|nr:aminotransferase class IV [Candidatus Binatia bacterium]
MPEADAFVPLNDRGFLLGDGLFETIRVAGGKPFRFAQHLERLSRGAVFLKITLPFTSKQIQKYAVELVEKNQLSDAVLRVMLTRGPGPRGYSIRGADKPTLAMTLHPLPPVNPDEPLQWSLITSSFRIPAGDVLASFKTSSKVLNVLARAEAEEKGADEALLVNTNGEVGETAGGNIFWIYHDKVCTVPTGRGVLPGITRAVVLELCQALGLETNKRVIKPEHLRNSEGIFVTQSAFGIVPVASFNGEPVAPSPLVDQIANAYNEMMQRESA